MIEQATGSELARTELDQVRTSSTTPRAAQDFAALFAEVLGGRAPTLPGLTQTVRDELKNPNQVNLASVAAGEMASPSEHAAVQPATSTHREQARAETPPPAPTSQQAKPGSSESAGVPRGREAPTPARADAPTAQPSPSHAQTRPAQAQSASAAPASVAPAAAAKTSTSDSASAPSSAQGGTRLDALAGLTRAGPRADHRAAASAFKKPSQPIFHVERQQLTSQVSRTLAGIIARGGGRLTLRLSPQALGDVRVDVELREGSANAIFRADDESARDLLRSNLDALRNALEKRGVRVERLEVIGPHSESATPTSDADRTDGKESANSGQQQPWNGGSAAQARRAPAEAGGGNMFEPEAEPGSATGPCVMVQRSIEGTVLRLDAIA